MALAALALGVGVAEAGKPGGGGPVPPGTIYFSSGGGLWSMNPDGSGKAALPTSVRGVPSNQAHGGARWFLTSYYGQIHATRGDGSSDVQLWSDTTGSTGQPVWGRDDSFVSFIATDAPTGSPVRIFRVDVAFDANGVPSAAGGRVAIPGVAATNGFPHAWSPSGDRVAWIDSDHLNVTTVATGATTSIASDTGYAGGGLAWSPDGTRIVFGTGREIHTIEPSGANRRIIVQDESGGGRSVSTVATDWSPDSAAIVYARNVYELQRYREYHRGPWLYESVLVDADVYRAAADGSATQNLTSGTDNTPIAWR
jgi:dipeptidyl aminopeptidase/acylaminoacyl peptidase